MKSRLMRLRRVRSVRDLSPPDRDTLLERRAQWEHLFDEYGRAYLSYASTLEHGADLINVRMSHEKETKCHQQCMSQLNAKLKTLEPTDRELGEEAASVTGDASTDSGQNTSVSSSKESSLNGKTLARKRRAEVELDFHKRRVKQERLIHRAQAKLKLINLEEKMLKAQIAADLGEPKYEEESIPSHVEVPPKASLADNAVEGASGNKQDESLLRGCDTQRSTDKEIDCPCRSLDNVSASDDMVTRNQDYVKTTAYCLKNHDDARARATLPVDHDTSASDNASKKSFTEGTFANLVQHSLNSNANNNSAEPPPPDPN